jgi:hypothetical protein
VVAAAKSCSSSVALSLLLPHEAMAIGEETVAAAEDRAVVEKKGAAS